MSEDHQPGFNTLAIHAGAQPDPSTGARITPIYQTTSYVFDSVDHAAALFNLEAFGNIYTRIMNPTQAVLESRVAALEGGTAALAAASGHAAQLLVFHVLMEPGDEFIASRQLYGGSINQFNHAFKKFGWNVAWADGNDPASFEAAITPRTKLISLTTPHNPTGSRLSLGQLRDVIALSERTGCHVLLDETYRDMVFGDELPLGASLHPHVISISSMSKSYGLPGIRVGWVICRDAALMESLLAAKEQILISGSMIDEELCHRALLQRATRLPKIRARLTEQLAVVRSWIATEPRMEWVEPRGGCVCFPRIKTGVNINMNVFYDALLSEFGTYVGAGHWFEMDKRYMRIGYGWPTREALVAGLLGISQALDVAVN